MAQQLGVADLLVRCLEREGLTAVFGIPGEENIGFVDTLARSLASGPGASPHPGAHVNAEFGREAAVQRLCDLPGQLGMLGSGMFLAGNRRCDHTSHSRRAQLMDSRGESPS
jgi:hypothetical protein